MNKKVFLMAALAASVGVFSGCSDDDAPASPGITPEGNVQGAVDVPSTVNIDSVAVPYQGLAGITAAFAGGNLTVELPKPDDSQLARLFSAETVTNMKAAGFQISNETVKSFEWSPYLYAFKNQQEVGQFYYANAPRSNDGNNNNGNYFNWYSADRDTSFTETEASATFVYVAEAVTVTGNYAEKDTTVNGAVTIYYTQNGSYNLSFVEGWNIRYSTGTTQYVIKEGESAKCTSTENVTSSASGFKWYFYKSTGN